MGKQAASGSITSVHGTTAQLDPWPIPKEDVISGEPQTLGRFLWQSEDRWPLIKEDIQDAMRVLVSVASVIGANC